jgi:hypothetical protein
MAPKLTIEAMVRRIKQQIKYDSVLNVGASGLVFSSKKPETNASGDPTVTSFGKRSCGP